MVAVHVNTYMPGSKSKTSVPGLFSDVMFAAVPGSVTPGPAVWDQVPVPVAKATAFKLVWVASQNCWSGPAFGSEGGSSVKVISTVSVDGAQSEGDVKVVPLVTVQVSW